MSQIDISSLPEEFYLWISRHINDDPQRLRMAWRGREPWIEFAILQIECRRRTRRKLAAELESDRFLFPTELSAQQSTSDTLALFHSGLIGPQSRVVDLTAGLGIDAMHTALKVIRVTAVEIDPWKVKVLKHNASVMNIDNMLVLNADCRDFVKNAEEMSFEVAFIDPARRAGDGSRLFSLAQCQPDVLSLIPDIRRMTRKLIVKMSPMLDVTQTLRELPCTTNLYVLGAVNECKELLAVCDFSCNHVVETKIHVVSPDAEWPPFIFTLPEEENARIECAEPVAGMWLYEPSAPAMKAGPWGVLCSRFDLKKLHPNTNLYVSDKQVSGFPGTCWVVDEILPFASSVLKRFASRNPDINVSVRNFPLSADNLRRKLRVADRSDDSMKVIGATVSGGKQVLLILSKS